MLIKTTPEIKALCKKIKKTPSYIGDNWIIFTDGTSINNLKSFLK